MIATHLRRLHTRSTTTRPGFSFTCTQVSRARVTSPPVLASLLSRDPITPRTSRARRFSKLCRCVNGAPTKVQQETLAISRRPKVDRNERVSEPGERALEWRTGTNTGCLLIGASGSLFPDATAFLIFVTFKRFFLDENIETRTVADRSSESGNNEISLLDHLYVDFDKLVQAVHEEADADIFSIETWNFENFD